jgi:AbiV family abortive infection protein
MDDWTLALERATQAGPRLTEGTAEFNRACDHIVRLLRDAALLYRDGSWPTAAFLAITALEETAKTHIGMFRSAQTGQATKRGKDPLYSHKEKHLLAASPTVPMGSRLPRVIGDNRVKDLMELATSGRLVSLRESCLYIDRVAGDLVAPTEVVSKERSRELLLFALEAFDDALVGNTNHSYVVGKQADELFADLADA